MSMQVFPTAPSPTVTHLMNRDALIGGVDVDLFFSSLILVLGLLRAPQATVDHRLSYLPRSLGRDGSR
jgi:hypothetical protein